MHGVVKTDGNSFARLMVCLGVSIVAGCALGVLAWLYSSAKPVPITAAPVVEDKPSPRKLDSEPQPARPPEEPQVKPISRADEGAGDPVRPPDRLRLAVEEAEADVKRFQADVARTVRERDGAAARARETQSRQESAARLLMIGAKRPILLALFARVDDTPSAEEVLSEVLQAARQLNEDLDNDARRAQQALAQAEKELAEAERNLMKAQATAEALRRIHGADRLPEPRANEPRSAPRKPVK